MYQRTHSQSAMRRFLVDNYLHHYMSRELDDHAAKDAMLKRMKMKHGLLFTLDMFEAIRKRRVKGKESNSKKEDRNCDFHDHEDGDVCGGSNG